MTKSRTAKPRLFILEQGEVKSVTDIFVWAAWFEKADKFEERRVAFSTIGTVKVSTVFLGLDHGFGMTEEPVLWETMVFGGYYDQTCERYTSKAAAQEGHERICQLVTIASRKLPLIDIDMLPDDPEDYEPKGN
jgi:hypothetical protein